MGTELRKLKGLGAVKKILLGALIVVVLVAAVACGEEASPTAIAPTATPMPSTTIQLSSKPRSTSPDVSTSDARDLVAGNSAFAFDLYQVLREEPRNLFYSPYSISLALAMTYAGARLETEWQMSDTLNFALSSRWTRRGRRLRRPPQLSSVSSLFAKQWRSTSIAPSSS